MGTPFSAYHHHHSMSLVERYCRYKVPPVTTILRSPPRGVQTNIGRFQIVFNSSSPCLSWSPSRSFPVSRRSSNCGTYSTTVDHFRFRPCSVAEELQSSATDDVSSTGSILTTETAFPRVSLEMTTAQGKQTRM